MSKRFTDDTKWEDPWFHKLSQKYKLFWIYILDRCDNSGVWKVNCETAGFFIGEKIDREEAIKILGKRIKILNDGSKWWIKKFIFFQCGILSPNCKPHQNIINLLKNHSLFKEYSKGIDTLKEKDKEEEEEKEEEKEKEEVLFESIYKNYPRKDGKKMAFKHFKATVKTDEDFKNIQLALDNYILYLKKDNTESKFIKMASTWFNNWSDWINYKTADFTNAKDPVKSEASNKLIDDIHEKKKAADKFRENKKTLGLSEAIDSVK